MTRIGVERIYLEVDDGVDALTASPGEEDGAGTPSALQSRSTPSST